MQEHFAAFAGKITSKKYKLLRIMPKIISGAEMPVWELATIKEHSKITLKQ